MIIKYDQPIPVTPEQYKAVYDALNQEESVLFRIDDKGQHWIKVWRNFKLVKLILLKTNKHGKNQPKS